MKRILRDAEIKARIEFFRNITFPLLSNLKMIDEIEFEGTPDFLSHADEYAEGLWERLMLMYQHFKSNK